MEQVNHNTITIPWILDARIRHGRMRGAMMTSTINSGSLALCSLPFLTTPPSCFTGTFDPEVSVPEDAPKGSPSLADQAKGKLGALFQKAILYGAFYFTRRPERIKQVSSMRG